MTTISLQGTSFPEVRDAVAKLCQAFPGPFWRELDREQAYPEAFVRALSQAGYLAALIPEEYGGAGLPLAAAAAILEEVQRAGCNGSACHAQMYIMGERCCATETTNKREGICPASRPANYAFKRSVSQSQAAALTLEH